MVTTTLRRRTGFTIVEILIVIIIILILAGLLLPAVLSAVRLARRTAARVEVQGLSVAMEQYKDDFAVYPPSCVWWEWTGGGSKPDWPSGWPDDREWHTTYPGTWNSDTMDTMDGAECLVYFLGGGPRFEGFDAGAQIYGPYYDFKPDGLIDIDHDGFREMQDAFRNGQAYIYFKADRSKPGAQYTASDNAQILDGGGKRADGSFIPAGPGEPIRDSSDNFFLPTKFQIICAGGDGRYARRADGDDASKDDITNFLIAH